MDKPILSVIIVSYNTAKLTVDTIRSIEDSFKKNSVLAQKTEVIVIDNASSDASISSLKELQKKLSIPIRILENTNNLGFGVANNQGVATALGKYYLFLNSDTIVQKGALEKMYAHFTTHESEENPVGILAASLLNQDKTHQPQGGSLPTLFTLATHMLMLDDVPYIGKWLPSTQKTGLATQAEEASSAELIPIGWVGGTALFTSAEVMHVIGLFDQNIFMYGEDTELCLRARNHGYRVVIDSSAHIVHLQNKSSTSSHALEKEFEGILYIFSKHTTSLQVTIAKGLLCLGACMRIIVFSYIQKKPERVAVYKKVLNTMLS